MARRIQSLLIGINEYHSPYQLNECVNDVDKFNSYLLGLKGTEEIRIENPEILINKLATKSNIVESIKEKISDLSSNDVFLFYYSGHGAQQLSAGRFIEDYNGLHQCLVCYSDNLEETNNLLADKELRYLFNSCKTEAHIIAIFDCCHSGGITRSLKSSSRPKRISALFHERPVEDYIFYNPENFKEFSRNKFNDIFPDANVINLSASLSNESSWEDANGGVFTRVLLSILNSNDGFINYNELIRQSEYAIRLTTKEKQTPNINVLGNKRYDQLTSWLSLNGDRLKVCSDYITYNKSLGWLYCKGSLMNVKVNDTLKIKLDNSEIIESQITKVNLSNSLLEDLSTEKNLDKNKNYAVLSLPALIKPKVYIKNIDNDTYIYKAIKEGLNNCNDKVVFTENQEQSDYYIVIFNQQVYFTYANEQFKPINEQFDFIQENKELDELTIELIQQLYDNIEILSKWFHLKKLSLGDNFISIPITIEAKPKGSNTWLDVTQGNLLLEPIPRQNQEEVLFNEYEIKVTNKSNETLFITALALVSSLHEISAYPFDQTTIMLEPNKSASFDNAIYLDHYQEFYNWDFEKVVLKFLVNNHTNLTQEIPMFTQKGFMPPLTQRSKMRGTKGAGLPPRIKNRSKSAIYTSEIKLINTTKNQVTGLLKLNLEKFLNNELIRPYIERSYLDVKDNGLVYDINFKPNGVGGDDNERSLKMNIGNIIDYTRRNRKFKKALKLFPNKPIIVAEGDSWFLYPILVKDTLDYIMEDWPLKSLAWAGDTLENYKKSGQLLKYVKKLNPKYVLISGGGNDIIGSDIQQLLKNNVKSAKKPSDYLNDNFIGKLKKLEEYYVYFFTELNTFNSVKKIIVHGYDYIRADHAKIVTKGGWLNKYLENAGIKDHKEREKLIKYLIDEFNEVLIRISRKFNNVIYLDMRGLIESDEWYDEIHPNDQGYKKVADKFINELN